MQSDGASDASVLDAVNPDEYQGESFSVNILPVAPVPNRLVYETLASVN